MEITAEMLTQGAKKKEAVKSDKKAEDKPKYVAEYLDNPTEDEIAKGLALALNGIESLGTGKYKGISFFPHTTGWNAGIEKYLGKEKGYAVKLTNTLAKLKLIGLKPVKGGVCIFKYDPEKAKEYQAKNSAKKADDALKAMGLV